MIIKFIKITKLMDWINVSLTSLSMSVDAMTVAAVDGVTYKDIRKIKMILIALSFGIAQFLMPVIGYFIGTSFKEYLETYIPYIAFSLLVLLGMKSLVDFIRERINEKKGKEEEKVVKKLTVINILIQAIATSIDALCIGFVFLDYTVSDAMLTFGIIGITTFVLSTITIFLGNKISGKLEKWGALLSAIVFILIGTKILIESFF